MRSISALIFWVSVMDGAIWISGFLNFRISNFLGKIRAVLLIYRMRFPATDCRPSGFGRRGRAIADHPILGGADEALDGLDLETLRYSGDSLISCCRSTPKNLLCVGEGLINRCPASPRKRSEIGTRGLLWR